MTQRPRHARAGPALTPDDLPLGPQLDVPADGEYTLRVRVEPPTFMRHDEVNGRRFTEPVDVEFRG